MPTLASTTRAQIRYIVESVFGTIPVAGNPNNMRVTGESMVYDINNEVSKEIRSDRQITDVIPVSAQAVGGQNFELSYCEFDTFLEAVSQGAWGVYGTKGVGTTFSGTFAAGSITAAVAPVGANAFTTLVAGQWIRVTAPATPAIDGKWVKLHAVTAPTSTVITLDASTPLSVAGPIANSLISASRLTNGTTQRSFSIEKAFNDVVQFFGYRGMTASKLSLAFQTGAIVTGNFDFMGKDGVRGAVTALPGAPIASLSYDVMNAVSGVGQIFEGGAPLTSTFIKSVNLDLDNKLRGQTAIGTLGNVGIGSGSLQITGTMEVYLADGTLYDKFVNNTASQLSLRAFDGAGNGYVLTLPKLKYTDAKVVAGSIDQDAMISLPFTAMMDPTTGKTFILDRAGVATP